MLRQAPWRASDSCDQPREQTIKKQKIREQAERISEQPLAVAPEPIDLREAPAPSMTLPTLQGNSHDPARALANCRSRGAWKELARGDHVAVRSRQRHENLRAAQ